MQPLGPLPPNAVDSITIRGFKSIAAIESLKLRPINILIGSNGSGKSNFIGAFGLLREILEGRLHEYVVKAGGAEKILHFGSRTTKSVQFEVSFADRTNGYSLSLAGTNADELRPVEETISFWDKSAYPGPYTRSLSPRSDGMEAGISGPLGSQMRGWVRARLQRWLVYHVHDTSAASPMRKTARLHDNQFLRSDGANLASFLYLLREKHHASYTLIQQTVRRVAPFFEDFQLQPLSLNPDDIKLEWRHKGSDQYFDVSSLSDGTLRFIALATLFLQPDELIPSTILVDEPELGLHPVAIEILAALIRHAATRTQVIVSTQSSSLVSHFEPEDVLVADRVGNATKVSRLERERLVPWLEDYSLGELWEKNEFGGRPRPE